jgi:thioredoxin
MNAANPSVIELKTDAFKAEVIDNGTPILIDFWAPWCGPCRIMKPHLEETAKQLAGVVRVSQVNVDEEPKLADAFGIQSIPTLVLMQDGKVIDAMQGVVPSGALVARIRERLAQPATN